MRRLIALLLVVLGGLPSVSSAGSLIEVDAAFNIPVENANCERLILNLAERNRITQPSFGWFGGYCSGFPSNPGLVEVGIVANVGKYSGGSFVAHIPYTVTAIYDDPASISRRVSSYPQGEALVLCAALFAFFLGFRTGMA